MKTSQQREITATRVSIEYVWKKTGWKPSETSAFRGWKEGNNRERWWFMEEQLVAKGMGA